MSGLDKMKARILEEARQSAAGIVSDAREKAEAQIEAARAEALKEAERIEAKASSDARDYAGRTASSLDMRRKQAILGAKQEVIGEVLDRAYRAVLDQEDKTYFEMLEKMLGKYVLPADGKICFSQRDLDRMPEGFTGRLKTIAAAKGGTLTVSDQAGEMDGGFILTYGGIEENCTIKAVFDSGREELSDQVNRLLFG